MFLAAQVNFLLIILPIFSILIGYFLSFLKFSDILSSILLKLRILEVFSALFLLFYVFFNRAFEFNFFSKKFFANLSIEFGFRADELSTIILTMITILSLCIFNYSIRYLDGENKIKFYQDYQFTILFVILLVISNNLIFFFGAWLGIGYGLHKLLTFYSHRPKAILAAQKKRFIGLIGDISLLIGIILIIISFKTANFSQIIALSHNKDIMLAILEKPNFSLIGIFITIGALAKSAQFPFHFWLAETMETPTPVSALMHAGIINAGGYLILRLAPILSYCIFAHIILITIGGITAVFGALIMMTQNNIKKQLAYSTISQLGFMMIQCGLGTYYLALFHMIGHGFYKANAFLSTPDILYEEKAPKRNLSNYSLVFAYILSFLIILYNFYYKIFPFNSNDFIYFSILILALTQVFGSRKELFFAFKKNIFFSCIFFVFSFLLYIFFQNLVSKKFTHIMPQNIDSKGILIISIIFLLILFSFGIFLAKKMQDISNNSSKKIWMFFWNACYFPIISTKVFKL